VPPLKITIEVPWPKRLTLSALEKSIFKAVMAAGRQLLVMAFELIEQQLLRNGAGIVQRRRTTLPGVSVRGAEIPPWQTRGVDGYGCPLDKALGLEPNDPCSPWVRAKASLLAQAHPYRQAAGLLSQMIGSKVDHRRVWGWVQQAGKQVLGSWSWVATNNLDALGKASTTASRQALCIWPPASSLSWSWEALHVLASSALMTERRE
jgi:hypothetical protein